MDNIRIICHKPGFRRNGMAHEASKVWPTGHWSDDELKVFDNDPMFTIVPADENEVVEEPASQEPDIASLPADDPVRRQTIDGVINGLEAKDYGTDGQPNIKVLRDRLSFVPMPEEVTEAIQRLHPGKEPSNIGLAIRLVAVVEAIKNLKPSGLTKAGTPKIAALEKALGFKPTPEEIKEATPE